MANQDLQNYIEKSRQAGKTDDQIRQELLGAEWGKGEIDDALPHHLKIKDYIEKIINNPGFKLLIYSIIFQIATILVQLIFTPCDLGNNNVNLADHTNDEVLDCLVNPKLYPLDGFFMTPFFVDILIFWGIFYGAYLLGKGWGKHMWPSSKNTRLVLVVVYLFSFIDFIRTNWRESDVYPPNGEYGLYCNQWLDLFNTGPKPCSWEQIVWRPLMPVIIVFVSILVMNGFIQIFKKIESKYSKKSVFK